MPRKNGTRKVCQQCQNPYLAMDERKERPSLYCSRACRDEAMRTRVTLVCVQCQQEFRRKAYMAEWSQERGPFCSFRCYGRWQKEHTAGEANPNYVPQSPAHGAGQWERSRLEALARDQHRCVQCGRTNRLHVHHIVPWEEGQTNPHALGNLETLCASCHRRRHPMPKGPDGRYLSIQ